MTGFSLPDALAIAGLLLVIYAEVTWFALARDVRRRRSSDYFCAAFREPAETRLARRRRRA